MKVSGYPGIRVSGLKELFLCLLSAISLILSFPNFNLWILAWFGFVPLFFALENKSKFKAFLLSYLSGVIFWLGTIYWLIHVTLPGMIILVLYLALYYGLFGFIISQYLPCSDRQGSILFIPSVWVLLEYLRSRLFTGFGWTLLGYSQYLNLPIIQIADITGAWGVSFLVMMVNVVIKEIICYRLQATGYRQKIKKLLFLACVLCLVSCGYGLFRLNQNIEGNKLKVSVIQGNIPQELKWDPGAKDFIIEEYFKLSRKALNDKPDLIIWPEAAFPGVLEEEPSYFERVSTFAQEAHAPLLLGTLTKRRELYYNSALLVTDEGKQLNRYDKLHLVPFGEYIPLRKILGFLETVVPIGDFTRGREHILFQLPITNYQLPITFSILICFEDLFPELSRQFTKRGADFLVNITNDAWFKRTSAPYQHLQASVFRAIENRLFLIRSANTGVSGFIAPSGEIISLVKDEKGRNIFINGYDTEEIILSQRKLSFYTRYGDIFILLCLIFIIYSIINAKFKIFKTF